MSFCEITKMTIVAGKCGIPSVGLELNILTVLVRAVRNRVQEWTGDGLALEKGCVVSAVKVDRGTLVLSQTIACLTRRNYRQEARQSKRTVR